METAAGARRGKLIHVSLPMSRLSLVHLMEITKFSKHTHVTIIACVFDGNS